MNIRLLGITCISLLVLGGLIAGTFANSIERALTLPSTRVMHTTTGKNDPVIAPVTTTGTVGTATVLTQDTFQRNDQTLWGTATDGRLWEGDANRLQVFSITKAMGQVMGGSGAFNALLGPASSNVEVVLRGSVNHFDGGSVNLGVVLRWTDTNNWYKLLINATSVVILKRVNSTSTTLATVPFHAHAGSFYMLRFRAIGATLFAKAWPANAAEPNNWMITTTDTALTSGQVGIRVLLQNDTVVRIASFLATAANSGM